MFESDRERAAAQKKRGALTAAAEIVSTRFPDLRRKLRLADMDDNPVDFIEKVLKSTVLVSIGLIIVSFIFLLDPIQSSIQGGNALNTVLRYWPRSSSYR